MKTEYSPADAGRHKVQERLSGAIFFNSNKKNKTEKTLIHHLDAEGRRHDEVIGSSRVF